MALIGLLIVIAMLVCIPMLVSRNPQMVDLDYYFGILQAPLAWQLLGAFIAGFLAALLILLPLYLRQKWRVRKARKRIIALESDAGVESTVDSITRSRKAQKKAAKKAEIKAQKLKQREAKQPAPKQMETSPAQPPPAQPAAARPAPNQSTPGNQKN